MRRFLGITVVGAFLALAAWPPAAARQPAARPAQAVQPDQDRGGGTVRLADFNDDPFDDLAIGAPGEDVGAAADAGTAVAVFGGDQRAPQTVRQGAIGIAGVAEPGDRFGAALAIGDFNEDNFSDLAVGVPGEDVGGVADAGAVNILYGAADGMRNGPVLTATPRQPGGHFGAALAAGDFDNDFFDDLAIGAPDGAVGGAARAGRVTVLFGGNYPGGPRPGAGGHHDLQQGTGTLTLPGQPEAGDRFGAALAAGDLTGDFSDELAIGAPGEDVGTFGDAGAVNLLDGTVDGMRPGALYLQGRPERGDRFGAALTLNDFTRSGDDDLAVGAPGETVDGVAGAGAVSLFDGTATTPGRERLLHGGLTNSGPIEPGDSFGAALGWYAPFSGDTSRTLVVGTPGRDRFAADAGAVHPCLTWGEDLRCEQHRLQGGGTTAEAGDRYGAAVTGGSYHRSERNTWDGDGMEDVAVGAPGETVGGARGAGAVTIVWGAQFFEQERLLYQGHAGIGGTPEPGDAFGAAVA